MAMADDFPFLLPNGDVDYHAYFESRRPKIPVRAPEPIDIEAYEEAVRELDEIRAEMRAQEAPAVQRAREARQQSREART